MAKKQRKPDLTTPEEILAASSRRQLRPGEATALVSHIEDLQLQITSLLNQISRLQLGHRETITSRSIGISLSACGNLELIFPDQHTATIPVGQTQHDSAIALMALLNVLRERHREGAKYIGSQGAPTKQDLTKIVSQSRAQVNRVEPVRKPKTSAPANITLADLDLDL